MGISDIVRGSSDPRETATAVAKKGQFGSLRLRSMQGKVGQFATDILQIKAQIMCKFFQPETLVRISAAMQLSKTDQQMIPQALEMLKNEPLRNFRIEVSADSMVQMDEAQDKQDRMEFLQATGGFMREALPLVQSAPQIAPLLVELMKFGVTAFRVGKGIEGMFDETLDKLKQDAANPQPKPNPEMQKLQAQMQQAQMKSQMDGQLAQQKMQMDMQLEQQKMQAARDKEMAQMQADQQVEAARAQADIAAEQSHLQATAQIEMIKNESQKQADQLRMDYEARLEQFKAMQKASVDVLLAHIKKDAMVEVAEINAKTVMTPEQDAAANTEGMQ
jgi:hypothetical protein